MHDDYDGVDMGSLMCTQTAIHGREFKRVQSVSISMEDLSVKEMSCPKCYGSASTYICVCNKNSPCITCPINPTLPPSPR